MQYNFFLLLTSVEKDATCIWLRSLQSFFLVSKLSSELGWFFCSSTIFMVSFQFSSFSLSFSSEYINDTTQHLLLISFKAYCVERQMCLSIHQI